MTTTSTISENLFNQPWLITDHAHAGLVHVAEKNRTVDFYGRKVEIPGMTIQDSVAIIPIQGPIGLNLSAFDKVVFGAVDSTDIIAEIDEAESNPSVETILFNINSPGGMFQGTPELADRIAQAVKTTIAYTNELMGSAAYWIGCTCDGVFATRSAQIGSIGTYLAVMDVSEWFQQMGIKVDVFKAGRLKGMGLPGTSLTDAQREHLQESVEKINSQFTSHVQFTRGEIAEGDMQGQVFLASEARDKRLIDDVVPDISALL